MWNTRRMQNTMDDSWIGKQSLRRMRWRLSVHGYWHDPKSLLQKRMVTSLGKMSGSVKRVHLITDGVFSINHAWKYFAPTLYSRGNTWHVLIACWTDVSTITFDTCDRQTSSTSSPWRQRLRAHDCPKSPGPDRLVFSSLLSCSLGLE